MKNPTFFALVGAGVGIVLYWFFIDAYPSVRIALKGGLLGAVLGGVTGLVIDAIKKKD